MDYKGQICVFLTVESEDWKIRCIHTHENEINTAVLTGEWDKLKTLAESCGMVVLEYNTTQTTPYNISKSII